MCAPQVNRELAKQGKLELGPSAIPTGELPSWPYSPDAGFVVFFDFAVALPHALRQTYVAYALYEGLEMHGDIRSLPLTDCELEPGGLSRAVFAIRRQFMHNQPSTHLQLIAEVQQAREAAMPPPPRPPRPCVAPPRARQEIPLTNPS